MIRVLIVERHPMVHEHLRRLCAETHDVVVVGHIAGRSELLEVMSQLTPDLVVMSLTTPIGDSLQTLRELKRRHPAVPAIVLSLHDHDAYALHALDAGASGFLRMQDVPEQLVDTARMFGGRMATMSPGQQFAAI